MESSKEAIRTVEIVDSINIVEFVVEEERFRAEYNSSRDQPSLAVVAAVAAVAGSDPDELSPLHSVIDTGALNDLFATTANGGQRDGRLSFSYEGFDVTVFSEGVIEAEPTENT
ncbi:HalOD1 output domain-containing protein [Natrinema amylolyticum]|uniref:HalOD1 output domain-containing protein n=1 Tax=Natrinema amylolyticum TaxID=2878679 RepID=UPI001CFA7255|nr:HalOD1 output domain-containing protein [Natrinema amylolyticum]